MLNKANSGSNKNDIQHRVCDMFRQNNLSCVFFFIANVQIKSLVYRSQNFHIQGEKFINIPIMFWEHSSAM